MLRHCRRDAGGIAPAFPSVSDVAADPRLIDGEAAYLISITDERCLAPPLSQEPGLLRGINLPVLTTQPPPGLRPPL